MSKTLITSISTLINYQISLKFAIPKIPIINLILLSIKTKNLIRSQKYLPHCGRRQDRNFALKSITMILVVLALQCHSHFKEKLKTLTFKSHKTTCVN